MADRKAVFDVFFRNNAESNFCIAAGLQEAIDYVENLHFDKDDIDFLREKGGFNEEFLNKLKDFKFTGDIYAVEEGTVVYPFEPLMTVVAPILKRN
jgi:Nicotinic acid phosphoribosyltransferase